MPRNQAVYVHPSHEMPPAIRELGESLTSTELGGPSVSRVEIWPSEDCPDWGVQVTDDGMMMTGYFTPEGKLIGDWF
jgi:hypothetical protein